MDSIKDGIIKGIPVTQNKQDFIIGVFSIKDILRDELLEEFEQFDHSKTKGFIRLTLKGKNFGHKDFPNVYAKPCHICGSGGK